MRLFIIECGKDISANQNEKYDFVIRIASGELDFNGICDWIRTYIKEKNLDL